MRYTLVGFVVILSCFFVAGCGGGSTPSGSPDVDAPLVPDAVKASNYTGSWSGLLGSDPVSLSFVGNDSTGVVTGNIYSPKLAGSFTGAVNSVGALTGTVANKVDGNLWSVGFGSVDSVVMINSATFGSSTLGIGSCTKTPALTTDLSGSWVGYLVKKESSGFAGVPATQSVAVELAYAGGNTFVGAVVSDAGLSARIKFQVLSGWWMSQMDQASSWGTILSAPKSGVVLTQDMIVNIASMSDAFVSDPVAPLSMQGVKFTTTYDFAYSSTVIAPTSDVYYLSLVRPGGELICPNGSTWAPVSGKCVAIQD